MSICDNFDPDGTGLDNGNYFGMPFTPQDAAVVLLSVPWDVTASYGAGSRFAPDAIIGASAQLDFHDPTAPGQWRKGIGTIGIDYSIQDASEFLRDDAVKVIKHLEQGGAVTDESIRRRLDKINEASAELNKKVFAESISWLAKKKIVGLVGGDHSTPFGLVQALAETRGNFSILQFDAHCDLREAYEGFTDSHASIMYNILERVPAVEKLVQVGIRDMCEGEAARVAEDPRIEMFTDYDMASRQYMGEIWASVCEEIVATLGENVYVSFDIDCLSPENAPNTGTPVPGGLDFNKAVFLLDSVARSGRKIISFDVCEVTPRVGNEWDANVGARILFKLCNFSLKTNS